MHENIIKKWFSSHKVDRKATKVVSEKRENVKGESMEEQEKVVETKEETKEEKPVAEEPKKEDAPVVDDKKEDVVEEKKECDGKECENEEEKEDVVEEQPNQVDQTEQKGNGIRIEDLVTKEILSERLSALESKLEAIINENKGLQDKLTQMTDKYEKDDFGGMQKQGVSEKDKIAYDSFEEYSKQFM